MLRFYELAFSALGVPLIAAPASRLAFYPTPPSTPLFASSIQRGQHFRCKLAPNAHQSIQ